MYNSLIPKNILDLFTDKLRIVNKDEIFTYAQAFDVLSNNFGAYITLDPFTTFALADRTGFTWKAAIWNEDKQLHEYIQEQHKNGTYGGSWELTANEAIIKTIDFIIAKYGRADMENGFCSLVDDKGTVRVPDGVTSIESFDFPFCDAVRKIILPDSVTSIGNKAMRHLTNLEEVNIPNSVRKIGTGAFARSGIRTVHIPSSVTFVGRCAFMNCERLENITMDEGVEEIGEFAFALCSNLQSVELPSSAMILRRAAFAQCRNLRNVTKKGTKPFMEENVFSNCSNKIPLI